MKQDNTVQGKHTAKLKEQPNAENNLNKPYGLSKEELIDKSKNTKTHSYEELPGTPFTLVKINIGEEEELNIHFLAMGNNRLTEPTETREQTLEKLESEKWMIMFTVAAIIVEQMSNMKINEIKNKFKNTQTPVDDNMTP